MIALYFSLSRREYRKMSKIDFNHLRGELWRNLSKFIIFTSPSERKEVRTTIINIFDVIYKVRSGQATNKLIVEHVYEICSTALQVKTRKRHKPLRWSGPGKTIRKIVEAKPVLRSTVVSGPVSGPLQWDSAKRVDTTVSIRKRWRRRDSVYTLMRQLWSGSPGFDRKTLLVGVSAVTMSWVFSNLQTYGKEPERLTPTLEDLFGSSFPEIGQGIFELVDNAPSRSDFLSLIRESIRSAGLADRHNQTLRYLINNNIKYVP